GFTGVNPVLRVDRDHVRANEFAGLAAGLAETIEDREILSPQDPHPLVGAVDQIEQALIRIARELQAEAAAGSAGFRTNEPLHQVLAVLAEHLDAIAAAIGYVNQAVLRSGEPMQRRVLLRRIVDL